MANITQVHWREQKEFLNSWKDTVFFVLQNIILE